MSAIFHRHRRGNHPHVHHHDDGRIAPEHHHSAAHHHEEPHHSHHEYGAHAYDVNGHQPAIVNGDPNSLGHWHFDSPFEHVALAAIGDFSEEFNAAVAPFINCGLNHLPQAARPPPALF